MAWITKPSGTMRIERRDEPYLTPAIRERLSSVVLPRYEHKRGAVLPCLHAVQHEYGWVPYQAMMEIAELLDLKPSDVLDTATFYEEYWLQPRGRHLVQVCRSIACEFCGQPQITDAIKAHLNIDVGETTDDGRFTLIEMECLGSCGTAPAVLIDETLHENVTPESIVKIIDAVQDEPAHH